jgi:hypothetical protein
MKNITHDFQTKVKIEKDGNGSIEITTTETTVNRYEKSEYANLLRGLHNIPIQINQISQRIQENNTAISNLQSELQSEDVQELAKYLSEQLRGAKNDETTTKQ